MRKIYRSVLISLPVSAAMILPSYAGKVRYVSVESALEGNVPIVVSAEGGGVNIDFGQTDEEIYKIRIDDSSKVIIDHCLVTKSCQDGKPEPNIALFRANIPQEDIPVVKTTQLTVLTRDKSGQSNTYIFPVTTSTKPTAYTKFVIGGTSKTTGDRSYSVTEVVSGVAQAKASKTLVDPRLKARVDKYLKLVAQGESPRKAAKKAGISPELQKKISEMGASRSEQAPISASFAGSEVIPVPQAKIPSKISKETLPPPPETSQKKTESPKSDSSPQKTSKNINNGVDFKKRIAILPASKVFIPTRYKTLSSHVLANALSNGLIVAYNKKDSVILSKRYKFNTAIRKFRAQKASASSAISLIPAIAKASGLTTLEIEKVLVYAGIPNAALK